MDEQPKKPGDKISVIIPHIGDVAPLRGCYLSLRKSHLIVDQVLNKVLGPAVPYEIIIVTDKPSRETRELLAAYAADIVAIINDEEVGTERAINQALKIATGNYLMILMSDARLFDGALLVMRNALRKRPQMGWVALPCPQTGFLSGVSMWTRKSFEDVGFYDEEYLSGGGFADDDYLRRMWKAGYSPAIVRCGKMVEHLTAESATIALLGEKKQERIDQCQALFKKKWGQEGTNWDLLPSFYPANQMFREAWIQSQVNTDETILEMGCAENPVWKGTAFKVTTCDQSKREDENCLPDIVCDAAAVPKPDKSFDVVSCCELLEHVDDPLAVLKEAVRLAKYQVVITVPNEHCYDDQTDLLTKRGFRRFSEVSLDDEVATLNQEGYLEYHLPNALFRSHYKGEMLHFKGHSVDLLVTPGNKMYVKRHHRNATFDLVEAKSVKTHKSLEFKKDAKWQGEEHDTFKVPDTDLVFPMELWLRFFGWWIAEGSTHETWRKDRQKFQRYITIAQDNKAYYEEIVQTVEAMGFKAARCKHGVAFNSKPLWDYLRLFGCSGDKFIPPEIKSLSPRLLMVLFEAMMKGDGGSYGAKGAAYTTKSAQLASDVQEILLKIGWSGSSGRGTNTFGQWWHVSINKTQLTPRIHEAATPEEYDGDIFDVTVPNHIICVRRNGKVVWSGNSWPEALKPFTNPGHKRFYTKPDLEALLKELGLPYRVEDIQRDYWWHFGAVVTIQARKTKALYLNLGSFVDVVAGEDWVNLDILPLRKTIPAAVNFLQADLSQGLPMYAEGSVDIIRASHLIEHLTLEAAHLLLNECRRVLKPGGLIRIAVPDLEVMIKWYRAKTMDHFNIDQPVEFILAPTDGEKFSRLMFSGDYAHRAIYDYPMMENFLRQAGFQRVVRSTQGFSHSEAMQLETKDQHPEISMYVEAIK